MTDNVRVVNAAVVERERCLYKVDGRIKTSNGKAHIHVIFAFHTSTISDFVHHQTCFFSGQLIGTESPLWVHFTVIPNLK